ncbi:CLUMA_CG012397, isoform A [Clunio marinus]|uniref:CLUMA_CG012397, isoform A n=1 Tax=Clunio marinus TaxID=568069 RepID=A0A1J1IJG3_9DIPT|nr:CLUMA_CG012397, isoform A [Clunio marinus]
MNFKAEAFYFVNQDENNFRLRCFNFFELGRSLSWWAKSFSPCDQAIDQGDEPCDDSRADFVWFYFESQGICVTLEYTGCGGNDNRFESEADCMMECVQP